MSVEGFDFIILHEEDKELVRQSLMQSLYMSSNRKIIKQYVRCITTISRFDYPEKWSNFLPQIVQYLVEGQKADEKAVMAGLLGLRGLVKKYEYEMEDEREPLDIIIQ